jgi:hypothetical protein
MEGRAETYTVIAGADGIGHKVRAKGRATRTVCDLPATDERHAYPARSLCWTCAALTAAPMRGTR